MKIFYKFIIGLFVAVTSFAQDISDSQNITQDKTYQVINTSKIELVAIGNPSMLTIDGTGHGLTGTILVQKDGSMHGDIQMDLNTLDSGLEIRTMHMKEKYLEVGKSDFSKARFKISKANFNQNPIIYEGSMYLHGIEKSLSGTGEIKKTADGFFFVSDFKINIEDYGITIPNYAGITIEKMIAIKLNLNSTIVK